MDAVLLATDVRTRAEAHGLDVGRIDAAIALAAWAHREQRRRRRGDFPSTSYIEHPLRNAARVLRWGVTGEAVVIACLLHDTVEDHAFEIAEAFGAEVASDEASARAPVLAFYAAEFGERTATLVAAMSNPLEGDESDDEQQKHRVYRDHVTTAIADPDVAICKLADLSDNALSLHHADAHGDDPRTARLARKYAPLLPLLLERLEGADVRALMSDAGHRRAVAALTDGIERLAKLV